MSAELGDNHWRSPAQQLGEEDADAFFLRGDEGTYEGGPADSLAPVHLVAAEDARALLHLPTPAQLERRERTQRWVAWGIGSLSVALLLAVSVRWTQKAPREAQAVREPAVAAGTAPLAGDGALNARPVELAATTVVAALAAEDGVGAEPLRANEAAPDSPSIGHPAALASDARRKADSSSHAAGRVLRTGSTVPTARAPRASRRPTPHAATGRAHASTVVATTHRSTALPTSRHEPPTASFAP